MDQKADRLRPAFFYISFRNRESLEQSFVSVMRIPIPQLFFHVMLLSFASVRYFDR